MIIFSMFVKNFHAQAEQLEFATEKYYMRKAENKAIVRNRQLLLRQIQKLKSLLDLLEEDIKEENAD